MADVSTELQTKFEALIAYSKTLVFKDQLQVDLYETDEASKNGRIFINAYLAGNDTLVEAYKDNTIIDDPYESYREQNTYYRNLYINSGVDLFISRISEDFDIIGSTPDDGVSSEEEKQFKDFYISSMTYFKHVLYSSAFHDTLEIYRQFIRFFVTFMAIERYFDWLTTGENINMQVNTDYGINQLLLSQGIDFLDDLPTYYKKKVLYNLGYIIRNKGSAETFQSIFEIFNLSDVEVFKYYLTKQYNRDTNETDVYFLKIPFDETSPRTYVESLSEDAFYNIKENYTTVIENDPSWKATLDDVKAAQFNFIASKYIDIESIRNIQKYSTDLAYFMSFLYQIKDLKDHLANLSYYITLFDDKQVSLFNLVCTLNACMMRFCGYEDIIISNASDLRTIYKFNPNIDTKNLSTVFKSNFSTSAFIPLANITSSMDVTYMDLILTNNLSLRDKLLSLMENTTSPEDYWKLEKDYNYLFMSTAMNNIFNGFSTYHGYLEFNSAPCFDYFVAFDAMTTDEQRTQLNELYTVIENIIDVDRINFGNRAFLITYLRKLIAFFKSYTVDLRDLNFSFYIDGPLEKIKMLDSVSRYSAVMHQAQIMNFIDSYKHISTILVNNNKLELKNKLDAILSTFQNIENMSFTDMRTLESIINFDQVLSLIETITSMYGGFTLDSDKVELNTTAVEAEVTSLCNFIDTFNFTDLCNGQSGELNIAILVNFTEVMTSYAALNKDDSIFLNPNFAQYMTLLSTFDFKPTIPLTESMEFNAIDLNEAQTSTYTDRVESLTSEDKQSKTFFKDTFELVQLL